MKLVRLIIILLTSTTLLKSQTSVNKTSLIKEISEFHDEGIPKTINYLDENLEIVIQETYDIYSTMVSSYRFNPNTKKKEGPFTYYPFSKIYDQGFRNSKNDYDFENIVNNGFYQNGILKECFNCTFFIDPENKEDNNYLVRKGNIIDGRYIGDVEFFKIIQGTSIGSIQSVSDQLSAYYGKRVNYTVNYANGEFEKIFMYKITFDNNGYVKDGTYKLGKNEFHFENKILTGILTFNKDNMIVKDSIFRNNKIWKIDNKITKNNGWFTSNDKLINTLNLNFSNNYSQIMLDDDENFDGKRKIISTYGFDTRGYHVSKEKRTPVNLIYFGSEKSELLNRKNQNFHGYFSLGDSRVEIPFFYNIGINHLRPNKLDNNGVYSIYDNEKIYKYVNIYLRPILSLNKDINDLIKKPTIISDIVNYKDFDFSIIPKKHYDDYSENTYLYFWGKEINRWNIIDYSKKYFENKTIDSLNKDISVFSSNLDDKNYLDEKYIKYQNYSIATWLNEIVNISNRRDSITTNTKTLISEIEDYNSRIESQIISLVKLTNSNSNNWSYPKNSPYILNYINYLQSKISKLDHHEIFNQIIFEKIHKSDPETVIDFKTKLDNLGFINDRGGFSDLCLDILNDLVSDIQQDIKNLNNYLEVREKYLSIFFDRKISQDFVEKSIDDKMYTDHRNITWINFLFDYKKIYKPDYKLNRIFYSEKNIQLIYKSKKNIIKQFGEQQVRIWDRDFTGSIIETRISMINIDKFNSTEINDFIDTSQLLIDNSIEVDFSNLYSFLNKLK